MNRKSSVAIIAVTVLVAISGMAAGEAQATSFEPAAPLGSIGLLPLTPVSQQSAVRAAENYLDVAGLSRAGLIRQLTSYDGFSTDDATFAVDSITVDWNEQAARSAKNYLEVAGLSRSRMIDQLTTYDGYTSTQAAYGATAAGL
jgi:hypothetical protein